ncbi:MAG: hypothetical protein OK457_05995 [Thaumarchaeota archaeon]|nr:hypothetical protein [Nitrososphaerota archaeon]
MIFVQPSIFRFTSLPFYFSKSTNSITIQFGREARIVMAVKEFNALSKAGIEIQVHLHLKPTDYDSVWNKVQ